MWLRFDGNFLLIENISFMPSRWHCNYEYLFAYRDLKEWNIVPDAYEYCIRCLIKEKSSKVNEKRLIKFGITTSVEFLDYINAVRTDHHEILNVVQTLNIEARKKKEDYFDKRRGTIGSTNLT